MSSLEVTSGLAGGGIVPSAVELWLAQVPEIPNDIPTLEPGEQLPNLSPEPEPPLPDPTPIPAPEELLPVPAIPVLPEPVQNIEAPRTFVIEQFSFVGNTAFSEAELQAIAADYRDRPITLNELFAVRTAITQAYVEAGYINSGAYLPTQRIEAGVVEIRIIEGRLEDITIEGLGRLNPNYIRDRIAIRSRAPLNVDELVEALQLLQLDPLIEQISADLAAGANTGASILNLTVTEADVVSGLATLDNTRSPLVGSFRRRAVFSHGNLTGQGDRFTIGYSNTEGSNSWDLAYSYPINPYNGTVEFLYNGSRSRVIDDDFEILKIQSSSDELELGIRQPIYQTPREELALGLALSYEQSGSTFRLEGFDREPFLTESSDSDGKTRITAVRFRQEWTQRDASQVLALRSQFNIGTDWFGATVKDDNIADSLFFSWQGQAQYVRIFQDDTLLLLRLNSQLATDALLSSEQFRLGGQGSVRGYQQDQVTTDNGLFASVEARFPVLTIPEIPSSMQLAPFLDYGLGWDNEGGTTEDFLSIGVGMIWQFGDRVSARLDYGIPLLDPEPDGDSLQSQGLLFTLTGELF
ncbi:MAG: ShlB/FhaC/HecB family hemolysin secretion/activation protein [Cyanobacteria bacterium J06639_14]